MTGLGGCTKGAGAGAGVSKMGMERDTGAITGVRGFSITGGGRRMGISIERLSGKVGKISSKGGRSVWM